MKTVVLDESAQDIQIIRLIWQQFRPVEEIIDHRDGCIQPIVGLDRA